ncbi:arylesterase [Sphingomonas ginsenosidivorax]|uniref:Arylesterase n=1 Tax=Sphingomonas ginsenosidivorax TaxID=862135 RepID=A0A5C6UEH8_9SPHN|nr:arylesterase [Sphingomonas ginsenosidivorax]TXC70790.1 arylesterase [Sphingomonas ginsenosidivorax]
MPLPSPFVLAFGDSLTAGYGLSPQEAFPARLEALLRDRHPAVRVQNAGVSGDTSASGRARLAHVLSTLRQRPDLAILELGANDFLQGLDPVRTRQNLDAMLTSFADSGIPVLLAGMRAPPFLGAAAVPFNAIHPDLAARHGVPLYPFFLDGVIGRRDLTLADGLHPNAIAVAEVARRILPHVEQALAAAGVRAAA